MTELTQLRPFGRRRKTYFYGVAGFVLAAHVVVGGIIHVIPKMLDESAPKVATMEMQVVDYILSAEAIETGAVQLIETAEEPQIDFEPAWNPAATVAPTIEPMEPTPSELPAMVISETPVEVVAEEKVESAMPEKDPEVVATPASPRTKPKATYTPPSKPKSKPSTRSSSTPTPKPVRRTVTKTRPKPKPKPAYTPPPPRPIPKAIPTNREPERTGLFDRLKNRRSR